MLKIEEPGDRRTLVYLTTIVVLALILRTLPYLLHGYFFEIGFDTGTYEQILRDYLDAIEWGTLPASPDPPFRWSSNDSAFFVFSAWFTIISGIDVNTMFRWVWPLLIGALMQLMAYSVGKNLSGSRNMGLIASLFLAVSAIQIDAFFESYWKQIFASFLLMLGLLFIHRFLKTDGWRNLILGLSFLFGTIVYHSAFGLPLVLVGALLFIILLYRKDYVHIRKVTPVALSFLLLAIPLLLLRSEFLLTSLNDFIYYSWIGVKTILHGGLITDGGGGITTYMVGTFPFAPFYIAVMPATFILALLSFKETKGRTFCIFQIMFIFLLIYCLLWLYFANRFVINLDLLVCVLAPLGVLWLIKKRADPFTEKERRRFKALLSILVSIFVLSSAGGAIYVATMEPFISDPEFTTWMQTGIDKETDFVVSNEWVSVNLMQKEYPTTANVIYEPLWREFLLTAATDYAIVAYFQYHDQAVIGKNLVVIIGQQDVHNPILGQEYIPIEDYATSPWFEEVYSGTGSILFVYRLITP